ncbi:MAG: radical SAM protein, partial [Candidatus Portnoybacteria bacterium]|nr:radical SAM protein [Candidatus Portnoybacteria bacterium]
MIRKENFGGIIFDERSHKIYTLNKQAFRTIELSFVQGANIERIRRSLKNDLDLERSSQEIENFIQTTENRFGKVVLSQQRGSSANELWSVDWNQKHFIAPISNFWSFTNLCNLHCTHCAWNSSQPLKRELNTEFCKALINEMKEIGVCELSFSGGEPLTRKNQLLAMAKHAKKSGFHLGLATNATLINTLVAEQLAEAGFSEIQVSVEGLEAHEAIRGKGIWEKTMAGIRILKTAGFQITFSTTINKTNLNELDNIFKMAKAEGIRDVRFVRFVPIGRGKSNIDLFALSPEE